MILEVTGPADRALQALQRLLADAAAGGQAKVDALVALAQRTVFVPTWGGGEGFRTLVNSNGDTALPIFTDPGQLSNAALRFGWGQDRTGGSPSQEVGARHAFRHAVAHDLLYVVVDITSEHSLEITRGEMEPLLEQSSRHGSGPYAGVGKLSSNMLQAVKPTPRPEPPDEVQDVRIPKAPRTLDGADEVRPDPSDAPSEATGVPTDAANAQSSILRGGVQLVPLGEMPADAVFDEMTAVLRGFPEVEWAAFGAVSRGGDETTPAVGVRIDASYRERVSQIAVDLRNVGTAHGIPLDVLLLDNAELIRAAREQAVVFYPWRRK